MLNLFAYRNLQVENKIKRARGYSSLKTINNKLEIQSLFNYDRCFKFGSY